jgi:hypothetical protein
MQPAHIAGQTDSRELLWRHRQTATERLDLDVRPVRNTEGHGDERVKTRDVPIHDFGARVRTPPSVYTAL